MASDFDNKSLGRFHLTGIMPAPRGLPQIEVVFDIDANGILNVTAKDKATSKEAKVTITHSSGLAKDEVEKMVKEAQSNESADKERRALVELKNKAENLVYQMEKLIKENKDKVQAATATTVEEAIKEVNKAREGTDKAALEASIARLEQASHKAAEEMYKAAGAPGAAPGSTATPQDGAAKPPEGKKDDVVDAEFRSN